jgi:SAM-dependent methyltransferase
MPEGASTFRVGGDAYERFVGRYGQALAERMCAAAGVAPGMRVLDVGCGPGALTRVLADRLSPAAVAAVDPSEPFVATCRKRVPGADVCLAAAEALPFGDDEFDAVLSQLVVNFLTDARAGVGEMRRVAKPGAVVAAAVWDYTEQMTLLRTFWDAAIETGGEAAAARDEGRVMPYCEPQSLGDLWRDSGLRDVVVEPTVVSAAYENFDDLWSPLPQGIGPAGAYTESLDERDQLALRDALHRRLGHPSGAFELTARAWCVVGRV